MYNKNSAEQENLYYVALTRGMNRIIVNKNVNLIKIVPEIKKIFKKSQK